MSVLIFSAFLSGWLFTAKYAVDNYKDFDKNAKVHLLNGMAYESYFGNKIDTLNRCGFNERRLIRMKIFNFLELDEFKKSREFIADKLQKIKDGPIFIPGDEKIRFSVILVNNCLQKILYQGKSIINYDGYPLIPSESPYCTKQLTIDEFREKIATCLNAESVCVDLSFNDSPVNDCIITVPYNFELIY